MNKRVVITIAVIIAIVGSGFAGWNLNNYMQGRAAVKADDLAVDVTKSLVTGNYVKAYRSTSSDFKETVTVDEFAEITKPVMDLADDSEVLESTQTQGNGDFVVTQSISVSEEEVRIIVYTLLDDGSGDGLQVDSILVQ